MAFLIDNKYRVRRNAIFEEEMKALTDNKIFQSYAEILTTSAIIGYTLGNRLPFSKTAETVLMNIFSENDYDLMNLIAFSAAKDKEILNSREKYTVFEEYANGGFPKLIEMIEFNKNTQNERESILLKLFNLSTLGIEEEKDLFN